MPNATKRSRLEKLMSTFEHFAKTIASIPDVRVQALHEMASGVRAFVATAREASPRPSSSAIASGLEQGLRETPLLIAEVAAKWRPQVSVALNESLLAEYPEFIERDRERLHKIVTRGSIRTEAEFYLVRHKVDLLEGVAGEGQSLHRFYSFVDAYEAKA